MTTIRVELEPRSEGRTAVMRDGQELACGTGAVVHVAARKLMVYNDTNDRLEAWRDGILSLSGPLGTFAAFTVLEPKNGTPRYAKFVPFPSHGQAAGALDGEEG